MKSFDELLREIRLAKSESEQLTLLRSSIEVGNSTDSGGFLLARLIENEAGPASVKFASAFLQNLPDTPEAREIISALLLFGGAPALTGIATWIQKNPTATFASRYLIEGLSESPVKFRSAAQTWLEVNKSDSRSRDVWIAFLMHPTRSASHFALHWVQQNLDHRDSDFVLASLILHTSLRSNFGSQLVSTARLWLDTHSDISSKAKVFAAMLTQGCNLVTDEALEWVLTNQNEIFIGPVLLAFLRAQDTSRVVNIATDWLEKFPTGVFSDAIKKEMR